MAGGTPTFKFSTTPATSGHVFRIYGTCTDWSGYIPGNVTDVLLTIKIVDGTKLFNTGVDTFTKHYTGADLVGDFVIDLTATELYGIDGTIVDQIYNVTITTTGTVYTYTTDEVFYYNAWMVKTNACYNAVQFIQDINSWEIKYASMVNGLYQGLLADIAVGNTSGIYEKINLFTRLGY